MEPILPTAPTSLAKSGWRTERRPSRPPGRAPGIPPIAPASRELTPPITMARRQVHFFNFDVSYFLLKAAGLPAITVAPNSFTLVPPLSPLQFTSVQSSGTNVVLQWTGAGTLQRAASPAGPWADMVDPNGAFSPYAIPASSPAMFYRLRQ